MRDVFICDAIRTPVGGYGGSLSSVRTDDLAAIPLKALMERNQDVDWDALDDVLFGCANQAGEDNRNVARMALLLAGIPETVPGATINRLCGSGMDAVGTAARAIRANEADLILAGGVESMSRSPWVMSKPLQAFSRTPETYDTTIGWRFVNKQMEKMGHTQSLIQTAENIAQENGISREDQDQFSFWSQSKAQTAQDNGMLAHEIIPVKIPRRKQEDLIFEQDEHLRLSSLEKLASLRPILGEGTSISVGNASGINDGAAALIVASEDAVKQYGLTPIARFLGMQVAGVPPRIMGMGPVPATEKLLKQLGMDLKDMDIIELNEAFAAQSLGVTRQMGLADDDPRINPLGGAIALGHPLGMSGARLLTSAAHQLKNSDAKRALCTMCIGVGQGISSVIEKV
ncbi:MAG: 3-oxoadipyl-CoA thiolase [Candidatus Marinimicrobia bacterium]|nr:3-oxoadipyl-CoA thiolase [Candidatus Neomarinimicrobiota bacterium]MCF7903992.1 3-oxoadipyl-CoA thiolase [Candidatus Neomarinimicrobiota bacterium]